MFGAYQELTVDTTFFSHTYNSIKHKKKQLYLVAFPKGVLLDVGVCLVKRLNKFVNTYNRKLEFILWKYK